MLTEDEPRFANWDQDETAVEGRYGEQDPATVADEYARRLALPRSCSTHCPTSSGSGPGFARTARRSRSRRSASYFLHDLEHHLHDVRPARVGCSGPDRETRRKPG